MYDPNNSYDDKPVFSSFVLIRGSIPVFWTQDPNPLIGKPPIILMRSADVQYVASKRHFAELLERYSYPIFCVNLTKAENARELVVSEQYEIGRAHV